MAESMAFFDNEDLNIEETTYIKAFPFCTHIPSKQNNAFLLIQQNIIL